jgi:hypothetical protein
LFSLIWKIYYDFFATLNPRLETYLYKKHNEWLLNNDDEVIIGSFINTLLIKPFNTDIFNIRNICNIFDVEITYHNNATCITDISNLRENMVKWVANEDFRSISQFILNLNNNSIPINDIYEIVLDLIYSPTIKTKMLKEFNTIWNKISLLEELYINKHLFLVIKIMIIFSEKHNLKKGKNIYIKVETNEINCYKTIENIKGFNILKARNILKKVCKCNIDNFKLLSLFELTRHKYDLKDRYWYHWEYHAQFSPIWSKRINQYKGTIDYNQEKIVFEEIPTDDLMQEFYNNYGLEPDEQPLEVQLQSIQPIENIHNWKWFNEKYKNNSIFEIYEEELIEFDECKIKY